MLEEVKSTTITSHFVLVFEKKNFSRQENHAIISESSFSKSSLRYFVFSALDFGELKRFHESFY